MEENQVEIWKKIPNYETSYQVSNIGNIISSERKIWNKANNCFSSYKQKKRKSSYDKDGYLHLCLSKDGKYKNYFIHRLVALSFIPNPENKLFVNHINGIKDDNRVENLEWSTISENRQHAYDTGLQHGAIGEKSGSSKLKEYQVLEIRAIGRSRTLLSIGNEYRISFQTVSRIINRNIWKHI